MKAPIRLIFMASLGLLLAAAPVWAKATPAPARAQAPTSGGGGAVDISAEESLEWYQDQRLYVARGAARAVRGDSVVAADILTARQRDKQAPKPEGGADIDLMTAEGHVKISDPKQQVFGEKAVYDLDQKVVKITGSNLKYLTEQDVVTARDSLEYHEKENVAVARGRAVALHQGSRIEADILTAQFAAGETGGRELQTIAAKGNVIIVTKDGGVSRGDRGLYDAKADSATLLDHVRITRGETQLAGDRAEVDFKTGQSRLLNDGSGRVRALLPSSDAKEGKKTP